MTSQEEEEVSQGIHAALFGVGRLQPLLEDPDVENIDINGYDNVFIQYADGREERGAPVADSDDELVELVQVLGSYSGLVSRPFDSANPQLDLRLPDGSRLSAIMDVCARPALLLQQNNCRGTRCIVLAEKSIFPVSRTLFRVLPLLQTLLLARRCSRPGAASSTSLDRKSVV